MSLWRFALLRKWKQKGWKCPKVTPPTNCKFFLFLIRTTLMNISRVFSHFISVYKMHFSDAMPHLARQVNPLRHFENRFWWLPGTSLQSPLQFATAGAEEREASQHITFFWCNATSHQTGKPTKAIWKQVSRSCT